MNKDDKKQQLKIIIEEYIEQAKKLCRKLKDVYGEDDVVSGWRQRRIPQSGYLDKSRKIKFSFHGVGCRFESPELIIDIDFDKDGGCEGFDLWRVGLLINDNGKFKDSIFRDGLVLEKSFKDLEMSGAIFCPRLEPATHLYYLSEM